MLLPHAVSTCPGNRRAGVGWLTAVDGAQADHAGDTHPGVLLHERDASLFPEPALLPRVPRRCFPQGLRFHDHALAGVSEAVLLGSREGRHFDQTFMEALVRPGRDRGDCSDRSSMPAWSPVRTSEDELSVYISQHYSFERAHVLCATLRLDGFASAHAGYAGGELVTKPRRFEGWRHVLNYSSEAAASVRVELQSRFGEPLPGLTLADAPDLYVPTRRTAGRTAAMSRRSRASA